MVGLRQIEEAKTKFGTISEKIEEYGNEQKARFEVFRRENKTQLREYGRNYVSHNH